jgi:hypothetical protein
VDGIFGYFTEHPERLRLVGLALAQHPEVLSEAVRGSFHRGIPLPMRILLDGIEKGELAPLHPVQTWWGMLGMCLYSVYMYRAFTERTQDALPIPLPTAEQRHEQIVQTLLHGLSRRPAGRRPGRKEKPS